MKKLILIAGIACLTACGGENDLTPTNNTVVAPNCTRPIKDLEARAECHAALRKR